MRERVHVCATYGTCPPHEIKTRRGGTASVVATAHTCHSSARKHSSATLHFQSAPCNKLRCSPAAAHVACSPLQGSPLGRGSCRGTTRELRCGARPPERQPHEQRRSGMPWMHPRPPPAQTRTSLCFLVAARSSGCLEVVASASAREDRVCAVSALQALSRPTAAHNAWDHIYTVRACALQAPCSSCPRASRPRLCWACLRRWR
jgi:hypothetical protein